MARLSRALSVVVVFALIAAIPGFAFSFPQHPPLKCHSHGPSGHGGYECCRDAHQAAKPCAMFSHRELMAAVRDSEERLASSVLQVPGPDFVLSPDSMPLVVPLRI